MIDVYPVYLDMGLIHSVSGVSGVRESDTQPIQYLSVYHPSLPEPPRAPTPEPPSTLCLSLSRSPASLHQEQDCRLAQLKPRSHIPITLITRIITLFITLPALHVRTSRQ